MPTTYYVANAGNNGNSGTSTGSPFQTIVKAQSVAIQGDTILLNKGDTFTEAPFFTVGVTLDAYGTGAAPIFTPTSLAASGITFTNCGGITVQNINFDGGSATYNSAVWLLIFNSTNATLFNNITVTNCTFQRFSLGVQFACTSSTIPVYNNINVTNNTFTNLARRGLTAGVASSSNYNFTNVTISGNTFSTIPGTTTLPGLGIYWFAGQTVSITSNTLHDTGASFATAAGGPCGIGVQACSGVTIGGTPTTGNVVYNVFNYHTTPTDGTGIDIDATNVNVEVSYNYIHDCDGPGVAFFTVSGGNKVHHNYLINTGRTYIGGIALEDVGACDFYANEVVQYSSFPCVGQVTGGAGATTTTNKRFLNNCFIAPYGVATMALATSYTTTGFVANGNYHQSGPGAFLCKIGASASTTIAAWRTAITGEAAGVGAGNCHLVQPQPIPALTGATISSASVFGPLTGAPIINAGADLSGLYSITPGVDFLGNVWTQNSIGPIYVGAPALDAWQAAVKALNPNMWLRCSEAVGTTVAFDSVCGVHSGTYTSVTLGGTGLVPSSSATSAGFLLASTSQGQITASSMAVNGCTFLAAIKPSTVTGNQFVCEMLTPGICYLALANDTVLLDIQDGSAVKIQATSPAASVAINTTQIVGYTRTAGVAAVAIYVNGVSQTPSYSTQNNPAANTPTLVGIGASTAGATNFSGQIQDIIYINSPLTAGQIAALQSAATFLAGTATAGVVTSSSIAASATDATGGATAYTYQWQQSTDNVTFANSAGTGVTTRSATITGLSSSTLYYLRLQYTDANAAVVNSVAVTATTSAPAATAKSAALLMVGP